MTAHDGYVTTADGVRLFFQAAGEGPHVTLVPNGIYLIDEFARLAQDRTVVFFDLRNRGLSDAVPASAKGSGGILQDADDVVAVSRHFTSQPVDIIGHSFAGLLAVLVAIRYPERVARIVQIGPMAPDPEARYPAHLTNTDGVLDEVMSRLRELQGERAHHDPENFCRMVWEVLSPLYVTDRCDAHRITWGRCHLPNERGAMRYFMEQTMPSIRALDLSAEQLARVTVPMLVVHGALDRSAPYGGGREWALRLPDARLLTVPGAGHAPWIEAPELVFGALGTFLNGEWPAEAERVGAL